MKIKIYTKRLGISIAAFVFGILFIILLIRNFTVKNTPSQNDNITYIKNMFELKNAKLVEDNIIIEKLPDDTFMFKYLFEDTKSKYEIYMKEDQSIVFFKKLTPSDTVNRFSISDVKAKAFKLLYKFAPYTKGNVEIEVASMPNAYVCVFNRYEGDKKVLGNWATVVLNRDNGELLEFNINWYIDINFKSAAKKGNEESKILSSIKVVPVLSSDSFLKYTTMNNILGLKDVYYDFVDGKVYPQINLPTNTLSIRYYNSYVDYAQKRAKVDYVKLKFGKILDLLSSQARHISFSASEFSVSSGGEYSYTKKSFFGTVSITADKYGNILKAMANLKSSGEIKKVDSKILNDKAEQIMQLLVGKYVVAKSYIFENDNQHTVSYKLYIGNAYIMNGKLEITFDKLSGEVLKLDFDLGIRPEFMEKVKTLKSTSEYINLIKSSGFEEVYVLTKEYGKVYLYQKPVEAHLALKPKFDMTYLMHATK
ncbi:hypothetical protein Calkro_2194 [Caldicellulosiruptor kronotskyensis 2002]|uniref:Uncharacterized protein n=1 Tax=Caldicellulosiruptor kronotskyensis (strain DSM 18902 / VKM B-2412 / 2002) TaxID=632348 RepID=E4SH07_CALK2|nr:hypothetical protein [Caldicellulosiruptor kronotskyensis]ADQ47032.1 hypothetical protein Calkro_2194 [Caldicellulosiruptor kronotskyensis 2002]